MSGTVQNLGADPGQSEILESKRGYHLERALYGWPAFVRTFQTQARSAETGEMVPVFYKEPPWAWLVCPRGHRVLKVELVVDHNWHLSLAAASEDAEVPEDSQRVREARWRGAQRAGQVCSTPGCPAFVRQIETAIGRDVWSPYCAEHDGDPWGTVTNDVHESRLTVDCEECSFTGTYRHSGLLALFARTVGNKKKTMRLPT